MTNPNELNFSDDSINRLELLAVQELIRSKRLTREAITPVLHQGASMLDEDQLEDLVRKLLDIPMNMYRRDRKPLQAAANKERLNYND